MKRVIECLFIVLLSTVCAMLYNYLSPNGIALVGEWNTEKGVVSAAAKNNPVVHDIEIDDITDVKKIYDEGGTVFIDARTEDAFNEGHIKGAISLPVLLFEDAVETFYESYPPSTPIITYCSGRECQDSHELAQLLIDIGYTQVQVFIDGYPSWLEHEFPVATASEEGGGNDITN